MSNSGPRFEMVKSFLCSLCRLAIFIVFLVSFTLYGIEGIAEEIEDPFGRDENGIALSK